MIPLSSTDASHCRDGLARFLYDAVFEHLVSAMNSTILDLTALDDEEEEEEDEAAEEEESESSDSYESEDDLTSRGVLRFKHDVATQLESNGKLKRNLDTTHASDTPTRSLSPSPLAHGGSGGGSGSDGGYRSYTPSPERLNQKKKKVKKVNKNNSKQNSKKNNNGNATKNKKNNINSHINGEASKRNMNNVHHMKTKTSLPWIGILDIFGFEHFEVNGFQTFLINTANESIQNTFNHFVFEAELRLFREEGISLQMGNRW